MIKGIIDTNILIEVYRGNVTARDWHSVQADMAITSITWLEFMEGARGKAGQITCLQIAALWPILDLTDVDQQWARAQLLHYRLSHGITYGDCLIASVPHRLQIPIYTQNVSDFKLLLNPVLVMKPY